MIVYALVLTACWTYSNVDRGWSKSCFHMPDQLFANNEACIFAGHNLLGTKVQGNTMVDGNIIESFECADRVVK